MERLPGPGTSGVRLVLAVTAVDGALGAWGGTRSVLLRSTRHREEGLQTWPRAWPVQDGGLSWTDLLSLTVLP